MHHLQHLPFVISVEVERILQSNHQTVMSARQDIMLQPDPQTATPVLLELILSRKPPRAFHAHQVKLVTLKLTSDVYLVHQVNLPRNHRVLLVQVVKQGKSLLLLPHLVAVFLATKDITLCLSLRPVYLAVWVITVLV